MILDSEKILLTVSKPSEQYAVTEPVLIQSCLIGGAASAIFACFWVTSTFILGETYNYNS